VAVFVIEDSVCTLSSRKFVGRSVYRNYKS